MEPFKVTEIVVSPRIMCPCGKSILRMTEEQKAQYDDALGKKKKARFRDAEMSGSGKPVSDDWEFRADHREFRADDREHRDNADAVT